MNNGRAERLQRLEVDVDIRLAELWSLAWEEGTVMARALDDDNDLAASVGALLRAAYGRGYCDALDEVKEGRRGQLARDNGYRTP